MPTAVATLRTTSFRIKPPVFEFEASLAFKRVRFLKTLGHGTFTHKGGLLENPREHGSRHKPWRCPPFPGAVGACLGCGSTGDNVATAETLWVKRSQFREGARAGLRVPRRRPSACGCPSGPTPFLRAAEGPPQRRPLAQQRRLSRLRHRGGECRSKNTLTTGLRRWRESNRLVRGASRVPSRGHALKRQYF